MSERWPRMLRKSTAAAYCDMSVAAFEREICAGRLPNPVILGSREHWCRTALDRALDIITGASDLPDYRANHRNRYGPQAA